jgi:hypothetical protein
MNARHRLDSAIEERSMSQYENAARLEENELSIVPIPPTNAASSVRRLWFSSTIGWVTLAIAFVALTVPPLALATDSATADSPIPTMHIVFEEMKELIPMSLDERRWSDPDVRTKIIAALDRLERAAAQLERHGRSREVGFDELALNFARDLREARSHYEQGAYEEARFFLTGSLQNCVSCHIRLPYERSFPLADELLDQIEVQRLEPRERAWLYVTVRRFGEALTAWEALMRDPSVSIAELDANGVLVDYLNVALRVRADIPRAQSELTKLSKRADLPIYLTRRLRQWRSALDSLDAKKFTLDSKPSLELGVSLAAQAGQVSDGPFGRDGLVQDLAAASQLVRWLEADRTSRAKTTRNRTSDERRDTAQAYYSLGVVESRSLDGFWVSLSERHLEAAIRADPTGPLAELAYAKLEEAQMLGYGGSSGVHLPADVWTNLRELRGLMKLDELDQADSDGSGNRRDE